MCRSGVHCLQLKGGGCWRDSSHKIEKKKGLGRTEEWESIRIGGRGLREAGKVRVGGGSA